MLGDSSSAGNLGTQHCSIIEASASAPKLLPPKASQLQPGSPLHTKSARPLGVTKKQSPELASPRRRSVAFAPDVDASDPDDRRRPEVAETMGHANECKDVLELASRNESSIELQLKALIEGQKFLQKEIHLIRSQVGADNHELEFLRHAQQTCENPSESLQHHLDGQPHDACNSPLEIQQEQQQQQQHNLLQHYRQYENGEEDTQPVASSALQNQHQHQHDLLQHYQQYENGEEDTQPVASSALQNLGYGMDVVQVMSEHVSSHARSLKSQVDANTLRCKRVSRACC